MRAAWRRIAAATHPDRDDGGDPARFGAAAAAYETLRTSFGRGEALADLSEALPRDVPGGPWAPGGRVVPASACACPAAWRVPRDRWHPQRRGAHRLPRRRRRPGRRPSFRRPAGAALRGRRPAGQVPPFRGRRVAAGRLRQAPRGRPGQAPARWSRRHRPGARAAGRRRHARRGGGDRRGRLDARDHRAGRRGADGYRVGPVATGLAGSVIQSDQDPTYRPAGMPARVRASTSCAAVTPEPQ